MPGANDLDVQLPEEEVIDVGKLEGTRSKDPRVEQDNISPNTPRFREVYKMWKENERKVKELEDKLEEKGNDEIIKALRDHNKQLADALERGLSARDKGVEVDKNAEELKGLETDLVRLKKERLEARENLKYEDVDRLEDSIEEVKDKIREVKARPKEAVTKDKGYDPALISAYNKFVQENEWFNEDPEAQVLAMSVDAALLKKPEFANDHEKRYAEVTKRVLKRFPEYAKGDEGNKGGEKVKGANDVEGGSFRGGDNKIGGVVKLTSEQLRYAQMFGLTPEQYAKQLIAIESGRR